MALGGAKPRAVLAVLLLHANQPVSAERLALALWGDDAPRGAVKTRAGPRVAAAQGARRHRRHRDHAGRLPAARRARRARRRALRARASPRPRGARGGRRRAGRRRAARRARAVARTAAGGAGVRAVRPARDRAPGGAAPGRARGARRGRPAPGATRSWSASCGSCSPSTRRASASRAQLMLALYRCGRQAEALDVYRQTRDALVERLGIEPGPELRRLHDAVLGQDPSLELPAAARELPPELDAARRRARRPRRRARPAARALARARAPGAAAS